MRSSDPRTGLSSATGERTSPTTGKATAFAFLQVSVCHKWTRLVLLSMDESRQHNSQLPVYPMSEPWPSCLERNLCLTTVAVCLIGAPQQHVSRGNLVSQATLGLHRWMLPAACTMHASGRHIWAKQKGVYGAKLNQRQRI